MFEQCSRRPNSNRAAMLKLVTDQILPSISDRDWHTLSAAIGYYGRLAGEIFSEVQGGVYRTSRIAKTIELARSLGLESATQSSWGPTVCAVAQDADYAHWCAGRLAKDLPEATVQVVRVANRPAQVELR
jgi:beta-ribofuranosylaminobenzene 5'-phosphate synthase